MPLSLKSTTALPVKQCQGCVYSALSMLRFTARAAAQTLLTTEKGPVKSPNFKTPEASSRTFTSQSRNMNHTIMPVVIEPQIAVGGHPPVPFPGSFPIEIEEHFIDALSDDFRSLRICSLTCQSWLPRSRLHLLRRIRIQTRTALDSVLEFLERHPHTRSLIRSVAMAPGPMERTRLFEVYPVTLLRELLNLCRWEIRAPTLDKKSGPQKLSFHKTVLAHFRYSPITEFHISSVSFTSHAEFIRLLMSFPSLRVLEYHDIRCTEKGGTMAMDALVRRRPLKLTTLQAQHWQNAEEGTLSCLLGLTRPTLLNLVLRRRKSVQWRPAGVTEMHQLRSLTLHVEQELNDGWIDVFKSSFTDAQSCMQALGCGGSLEDLKIHLHLSNTSKLSLDEPGYDNRPALLAVALAGLRIRDLSRELEQALLARESAQPTASGLEDFARIHLPGTQ
ncbi:hypothetical protein BD311DRAFT_810932 [Dichomitus squalens]|uniref:Uncharacterized protein n=1 Tax=Dichomitus squalens TaxID=114155 RepID=A0A4Q9MBZ6_9APHY|nr:hypothetical protein BD311DRAFT_810932 [Dichomitus squalens]